MTVLLYNSSRDKFALMTNAKVEFLQSSARKRDENDNFEWSWVESAFLWTLEELIELLGYEIVEEIK